MHGLLMHDVFWQDSLNAAIYRAILCLEKSILVKPILINFITYANENFESSCNVASQNTR